MQWLLVQSLTFLTSWVMEVTEPLLPIGTLTDRFLGLGVNVKWARPGRALDTVSGLLQAPGGSAARRLAPEGRACLSLVHCCTLSTQGHTGDARKIFVKSMEREPWIQLPLVSSSESHPAEDVRESHHLCLSSGPFITARQDAGQWGQGPSLPPRALLLCLC